MFGIDAVQAAALDQPVPLHATIAAVIRAEEQVILSAQTHRSQRVFRSRQRHNTSASGTGCVKILTKN